MKYNTDLQKDLWLKHIEVQERILQLNSAPIAVEPNTVQLSGQTLRIKLCQTDELDNQITKVKSLFKITDEDIDTANDTFSCAADTEIDSTLLNNLSNECLKYYIQISSNPIIDGIIRSKKSAFSKCIASLKSLNEDYAIDAHKRLQVSVDTLRRLDSDPSFPSELLPEQASGIFGISPTPIYFLRKWLSLDCSHHIKYEKVIINDAQEEIVRRQISIKNYYFSESSLQKLHKLWGLRPIACEIIFKVDDDSIKSYDFKQSVYEFPDHKNNEFKHHLNIKTVDGVNNVALVKDTWQIDLLTQIYESEFGEANVSKEFIFHYIYDNKTYHQFVDGIQYDEFFEDLRTQILEENISISQSKQSIGVDFDWRTNSPRELKIELSNQYDDMEVSIFSGHRCNIEICDKNAEWDKIESFIKDNYSTIKTFISSKDGNLHFVQEYKTTEQSSQFMFSFAASLKYLNEMGCDCEIHPNEPGKKKYLLRVDYNKIAENKENVVNSLRGAEFNAGGKSIGKLFKVIFPDLLFDISSSDYESSYLANFPFSEITPNLEGDIEKINRLRTALDNISTGKGVKNRNLSDFIFDASKASPTKDIEVYTDELSEFCQDIKNNLLNNHINSSQLNAIIKCLKASDISLIQGPPGTGKSTAIAELIWQHVRLDSNERILLTSETNLAVDNAIDRTVNDVHNLVKPIRFGSDDRLAIEGRQFSIQAMEHWVATGNCDYTANDDTFLEEEEKPLLKGKIILENWLGNIKKRIDHERMDSKAASLWEHLLTSPTRAIRELVYNSYKQHCNVVGATCSSIGENNTKNRPTKFFMNYCDVFGEIVTKTIYKKEADSDDEREINIKTYKSNDGITFTTVIQDESSKATPAELALPLIYGKKNIVIGDHRQLPPMLDKEEFMDTLDFLIDNAKTESELTKLRKLKTYVIRNFKDMEISHFQRIFENIDESLKGEFTYQYRMHPDINEVIKQFYQEDKGLECGLTTPIDLGVNDTDMSNPFSRYHGISIDNFICNESLTPENHVIWIDVNSPEMIEGTSRVNEGEIKVISHILHQFANSESYINFCNTWTNSEDKEIGIISFYSKQRNKIRRACKEFDGLPMKIDVVDRFQGMERNIVIVSMVRSNTIITDAQEKPDFSEFELGFPEQEDLGFAQSPNRLNVALSRAKRLLIIIGNSELFRQKEIYDNVYNIIAANPNGKIIKCNPYEDIQ